MTDEVYHGSLQIDFGRFGQGVQSCPAQISITPSGQPGTTTLLIPGGLWNALTDLRSDARRFLVGVPTTGVLNDGRGVRLTWGGGINLRYTEAGDLLLDVNPQSLVIEHIRNGVAADADQWVFYLLNLGFVCGDLRTTIPLSKRYESDPSLNPGSSLDRIEAEIAGRTISLRDRKHAAAVKPPDVEASRVALYSYLLDDQKQRLGRFRWRTIRIALDLLRAKAQHFVARHARRFARPQSVRPEASYPPGTLSITAAAGETSDGPQALTESLIPLLSLAMSAPVAWTVCELRGSDGQLLWAHHRTVRDTAVHSGQTRIDQDPPQIGRVIKDFLEECYPCLMTDQERLTKAIAVYVEAQIADTTLVRAALLNMLLDRLQKEVNAGRLGPQIDTALDGRVDAAEFNEKLRELLSTLSPNWTVDLTGQIRGEIKRRNSAPGFGKAVRLAFESLGVQGFQTLKLGNRHVVLHDADVPLTAEEVVPYLTELDLLVFMIIARRLGYSGQFWHPHLGAKAVLLKDLITPPAAVVAKTCVQK